MYCTEDDTTHGAKEPLGMQEAAIHALSIICVGIFRLLGECIVLQPRQQFKVHGHTLVVHLWGMHMHIIHSRDEQLVAKVNDLSIINVECRTLHADIREGTCYTGNFAVFNSNIAILENLKTILFLREENVCLIYLFHKIIVLVSLVSDCEDTKLN